LKLFKLLQLKSMEKKVMLMSIFVRICFNLGEVQNSQKDQPKFKTTKSSKNLPILLFIPELTRFLFNNDRIDLMKVERDLEERVELTQILESFNSTRSLTELKLVTFL
jgi:hypothetical protein